VYRRADLTARVLERIREARPTHLLVAADGPNPGQAHDAQRCQEVRDIILKGVDWPCSVETRFSETHLGCKVAVSTAIDWAFQQHEHLIIIEDDCLPNLTFFRFCEDLLERYADEPKVMQISGANLSDMAAADNASYYASRFGTIWGWATWRRAWRHYDVTMAKWPRHRKKPAWKTECRLSGEPQWRTAIYDSLVAGKVDTWDTQWEFAKQILGGISLIPSGNLVSNIGWGNDATHTFGTNDPRSEMTTTAMSFPLRHPQAMVIHDEADWAYFSRYCPERPIPQRVLKKAIKLCKRWLP
jgi:hypothetical protein